MTHLNVKYEHAKTSRKHVTASRSARKLWPAAPSLSTAVMSLIGNELLAAGRRYGVN